MPETWAKHHKKQGILAYVPVIGSQDILKRWFKIAFSVSLSFSSSFVTLNVIE